MKTNFNLKLNKERTMNLKHDDKASCWWSNRYELLGMLLLVIATILTIIAWDSFGIVAMFIVGLILIGHRHFCYIGCHTSCHSDSHSCETGKGSEVVKKESSKK